MKNTVNVLAYVCMALALGAHQTAGGTTNLAQQSSDTPTVSQAQDGAGERTYSFFYDQGSHLKDLIKEQRYEEASQLYRKYQAEFFDRKRDKYASQLDG